MRDYKLIFALVALAVPTLWFVRNNDPLKTNYYPVCILHYLTGLYCPGCGGTRAAHALLNGQPLAALAWNPFVILIVPIIVVCLLYDQHLRKRRGEGIKYLWHVVLGVIAVFFVLRNVPSPQHGWLAPANIQDAQTK